MKPGAMLSREAATVAIMKAGFGVKSFEGGPPPAVVVYSFRMTGINPGEHADARRAILAALDAPRLVTVDATGAAVVTPRDGTTTSEADLARSLGSAGYGLEEFHIGEWPATPSVYSIEVPAMDNAAVAAKVRGVLVTLARVFSAEVYPERRCAIVRLSEPCDAIESNVRRTLAAAGFEVGRVRLEEL